jgi:cation:H+ antiporter
VSITAAFKGHPDISLGNVVGSNIANIGLVLGLTAMFFGLSVSLQSYRFNWPMMMVASILLYLGLYDGILMRWEGIAYVVILIVFNYLIIYKSRKESRDVSLDDVDVEASGIKPIWYGTVFLVLGGIALYFGSEWLINGATNIALDFGISERVISVSIISVGTSVPELAASIVAAFKKEKDLSIGNLIGSNIFNILAVLGISSAIIPIQANDAAIMSVDIFWMLFFAAFLYLIMRWPPRDEIKKWQGTLVLIGYAVYMFFLFSS